jgi:hypothetical protein
VTASPADKHTLIPGTWQSASRRHVTARENEHALAFVRARSDATREDALANLCLALFIANEFI